MHREGPEYVADGAQGDRLGVLTLGTVSGILERWCGHLRESRSIHEITKKVKQVSPSASETTRITGMKKKTRQPWHKDFGIGAGKLMTTVQILQNKYLPSMISKRPKCKITKLRNYDKPVSLRTCK